MKDLSLYFLSIVVVVASAFGAIKIQKYIIKSAVEEVFDDHMRSESR